RGMSTDKSVVPWALRWCAPVALLAFVGCANSDDLDLTDGGADAGARGGRGGTTGVAGTTGTAGRGGTTGTAGRGGTTGTAGRGGRRQRRRKRRQRWDGRLEHRRRKRRRHGRRDVRLAASGASAGAHHFVARIARALEAQAGVTVTRLVRRAARHVASARRAVEIHLHGDARARLERLVDVVGDRGGRVARRLLLAEVEQAIDAAAHERLRRLRADLEAQVRLRVEQHL